MVSHLFYYQLAVWVLAWLFVLLHVTGSKPGPPAPPILVQPKRKRSTAPQPFAGLTQKPPCALCERETVHPNPSTPVPPAPRPPTHHRPRTVDTSRHFCPHTDCAYRGWRGLNNLQANGHPSGGAEGACGRESVACTQASQCGLVVRPTKGVGSRLRIGRGGRGSGSVGHAAEPLGHTQWSMTHSQTSAISVSLVEEQRRHHGKTPSYKG
jgi:hypothetical protein